MQLKFNFEHNLQTILEKNRMTQKNNVQLYTIICANH